MKTLRTAIWTGMLALGAMPAIAGPIWTPGPDPHGPPATRPAPAPVIGLGLPVVVAVGGYLWLRRRSRRGDR